MQKKVRKSINKKNTLLVPVDLGSRTQLQTEIAEQLAEKSKGQLYLLHALDPGDLAIDHLFAVGLSKRLRHEKEQSLAKMAARIKVPVMHEVKSGYPLRLVLQGMKKSTVQRVVLSTHGRKGLSRVLLGSITEEIVRSSIKPVVVIGPHVTRGTSSQLHSLVVACDLMKGGAIEQESLSFIQDYGIKEVFLYHSVMEGLHPVLQSAAAIPSGASEIADLVKESKVHAQRGLESLSKKFTKALGKSNVKVTVVVDESAPLAAIGLLHLAQANGAWILSGSHRRGLLARSFLGSTTRELILKSDTPVVVV
jgi:nucleotide-binding universal stress UspA family protein